MLNSVEDLLFSHCVCLVVFCFFLSRLFVVLDAVLKTAPFTARTAKRGSRFFCEPALNEEHHY